MCLRQINRPRATTKGNWMLVSVAGNKVSHFNRGVSSSRERSSVYLTKFIKQERNPFKIHQTKFLNRRNNFDSIQMTTPRRRAIEIEHFFSTPNWLLFQGCLN